MLGDGQREVGTGQPDRSACAMLKSLDSALGAPEKERRQTITAATEEVGGDRKQVEPVTRSSV